MAGFLHKNLLRRAFGVAAAVGLTAAFTGCTTTRWEGNPGLGQPRVNDPLVYPIAVPPGDIRSTTAKKTVGDSWFLDLLTVFYARNYKVEKLEFTDSSGQSTTAYLSIPAGAGPHPVVVVFPVLGGSYIPSEALSKSLVNRDYAVLHMHSPPLKFKETKDPVVLVENFRRSIVEARTLIDYLQQRPDIDGTKIGAAGISLGGILAATLTGIDDRVGAGVFILAGGNLPEILGKTRQSEIDKFRDFIMGEKQIDREEFKQLVSSFSPPVDPLRYAPSVDPCRVLLISGRFDNVIRPEDTEILWQHLGRPTWIKLPSGHYSFAAFFLWSVDRAVGHFDNVLKKCPCQPAQQAQPEDNGHQTLYKKLSYPDAPQPSP